MSPCVWETWQTVHGSAIAECTDLPLSFAAWQDEHCTRSEIVPGCSTAEAGRTLQRVTAQVRKRNQTLLQQIIIGRDIV